MAPKGFLPLIPRKRLINSEDTLNKKCLESKNLSFDIEKRGWPLKLGIVLGLILSNTSFLLSLFCYKFKKKNFSSWRLKSNPIIIKILDYVMEDFRGQLGRKTDSLPATRSCLVLIILFLLVLNPSWNFNIFFISAWILIKFSGHLLLFYIHLIN